MCRCCTEFEGGGLTHPAFKTREREKTIKIRAFHLRIATTEPAGLPETTTLVYPPGITSGIVEVNGAAKVFRPGVPSLLTLHRTRSAERGGGSEAVFASTDRVKARDGTRFEAYVGEVRAVVGVLRKRQGEWEVGCKCDEQAEAVAGVCGFEVRVVGEGGEVLEEKVELQPKRLGRRMRRRRKSGNVFCSKLEGIPEEGEEEEENSCERDGWSSSSSCSCSSCSCCEGEEWELVCALEKEVEVEVEAEAEAEAVSWAVDVGIWVVSLGVGLLVSKVSPSSLAPYRRWRNFLF